MELSVAICCRVRLYAEGVRQLMVEDKDVQVLGIASDDDEVRNLMQYNPDVIISDLESCKAVLDLLPDGENKNVLLVNEFDNLQSVDLKSMIANGLGGILPRGANGSLLQKAVRKLHEGELWIDHQTVREVLSLRKETDKEVKLTKKETEILGHICGGLSNKEIASKLYISEQTVKSHCNHLFKKFGVKSRLKLAITAPQCHPESLNRGLQ